MAKSQSNNGISRPKSDIKIRQLKGTPLNVFDEVLLTTIPFA
jgi:hypothetical protein